MLHKRLRIYCFSVGRYVKTPYMILHARILWILRNVQHWTPGPNLSESFRSIYKNWNVPVNHRSWWILRLNNNKKQLKLKHAVPRPFDFNFCVHARFPLISRMVAKGGPKGCKTKIYIHVFGILMFFPVSKCT